MKDYEYTTCFSSVIKPLVSEQKDEILALASLSEIGEFLPEIDTEQNMDLLPIAFNACVVNRANKNGDVIDASTAIDIYKSFINKPINIEHNRERLVGVVLTAGFSEFGTDKLLSDEEALEENKPFNITLGGVIWRIVNPELAAKIEDSSDPSSEHYMMVSASWELGFTDFEIAVVNDSKDIANAEIITAEKDLEKLKQYLKGFGGCGVLEDGRNVYRKVVNDVVALGIGLTVNPAADVKGVVTPATTETKKTKKTSKEKVDSSNMSEKVQGCEKKSSQMDEKNVATNIGKVMKINSTKDISDENLQELTASQISEFIEVELKRNSEKYAEEKREVETQLQAAQEQAKVLEEDQGKLKTEFDAVKKELDKLNSELTAKEAEEKFNQRMSSLDDAFSLSDEDREVIASEIKDMDNEAYETYSSKLKILLSSKSKEEVAKREAEKAELEAEVEQAKASEEPVEDTSEEVLEEAISQVKTEKEEIPVSAEASEQTIFDKYKQAFDIDQFDVRL